MNDLLQIFGGNVDLNEDPTLFFAFTGVAVLKVQVHNILRECLMKKRIEDDAINYVNDEGFTPFLYYINEFVKMKHKALTNIQEIIQRKDKVINNESIVDYLYQKD